MKKRAEKGDAAAGRGRILRIFAGAPAGKGGAPYGKEMKRIHAVRKHELVVYFLIWTAVFAAPAVSRLIETAGTATGFTWTMVWDAWQDIIPFFVLFWAHDLLVAPLLLRRRKHWIYVPWAAGLICLFMLFTCSRMPKTGEGEVVPPHTLPHSPAPGETPPEPRPLPPEGGHGDAGRHEGEPRLPLSLIHLAMALTMCGLNVGVKLFFKSQREGLLREQLRRESLQHELEALKFQINPHFFMNTLNNIHALVDIDPERAKQAIIELSVLMRYVLYEGSSERVPLARELDFLAHYIALMRLRFTGMVEIETHFTPVTREASVPPLVYATFVENAFKHGISYRRPSYVSVSVRGEEDGVRFECRNSLRPEQENATANRVMTDGKPAPRRHGIGLENVRKRLALIYGDRYKLNIRPGEQTFEVSLLLPYDHD